MIDSFSTATLITTQPALQGLVDTLQREPIIALDTESNSMYAYRGRVCLIQLSTRTHDYIIDPFIVPDLSPLGAICSRQDIQKVFHAAEYDLICMKRDFGFDFKNLFDTMYAARITGKPEIGLSDLLKEHFDITPNKKHQLDNWGLRPLPAESLHYAQMDTHYLIPLRDMYMEKLAQINALNEAIEVFLDVERIEAKEKEFDPEGFWRITRPNELNRKQMAFLAELFTMREAIAEEEDKPPFKIIENRSLIILAQKQPHNRRELQAANAISARQLRLYGDDILEALERGRNNKPPSPPKAPRLDSLLSERYIALHAWRKECAIKRGVDSNIIMTKSTLWEIAGLKPKTLEELSVIEGIGAWRLATYGEELLALVQSLR